MKKPILLILILSITAFVSLAQSAQVTLAWDASPTPGVTNYVVYASQSASMTSPIVTSAGTNLTGTVTIAMGTQWYFRATAQKGGLESLPSNQVSYIAPTSPSPPGNVRLTFVFPPGTTVTSTNNSYTITFP